MGLRLFTVRFSLQNGQLKLNIQRVIRLGETVEGDSRFVPVVGRALNNALEFSRPSDVYVVQVDGWFDHKWQQFSGF